MRRMLGWMGVVFLCCAAGGDGGGAPTDARLVEAQAVFDEGKKLYGENKYAEALPKLEHALALREAVLGGSHPDVAASLHTLANCLAGLQRPDRAEPLYLRALAIREQTLGKNHRDVARTLNNLALLYGGQGLLSRAEPLYQRTIAILEQQLGKEDPTVASALNNLGALYSELELYGQAEPLYQRALEIREKALGPRNGDVGASLYNLASLYWKQGQDDKAEAFSLRALSIWEEVSGKESSDVGHALTNLAQIYARQGVYERAEPLFLRALALMEKSLGNQHSVVALSLNNLGNFYQQQGLYKRAEPFYQRALPIREQVFGKAHFLTATTRGDIASLYAEQGLYAKAEPLYQRALADLEAAYGDRNPALARLLTSMAQLRLAQNRVADAVALLTRALSLTERRLHQESFEFSEARLATFLQHLRADEERLYALLRAHPRNPAVQRLALSAVLLRKGRSVEELANTSRAVFLSLGPQERETFERLRGLRTQLAALSLQGSGSLSPADSVKQLKELGERGDALEVQLAKSSAPLRARSLRPSPEDIIARVAASLPKEGALVEFVAYEDRASKRPSQQHYLALILFADSRIATVDLGPAAPIDSGVSTLHEALSLKDTAYLAPAQALYTQVFKPLRPLLGTTRRLFLAPDGQLALVPFAALHDGKAFLMDGFSFSYLTSGKDLLPSAGEEASSGDIVVMADPTFSAAQGGSPSAAEEVSSLSQRAASLEHLFSTLRADTAEARWAPLPGTRLEAQAIGRLLPQAKLLLGAAASKQKLLELRAPAVLHIATHGFFLENAATPAGSRALGAFGSSGPPAQRPADPLLRSGLVLAGANAQAPGAAPQLESTLATALELAGLNLWGTQLVVLSACDTGRGDVKLGQGVYGLRRALVVAGAQTVVMSLWKVNDDSTRLLMESYYQNLLAGQGRAQALQNAMLAVRQGLPHPYSWAPFLSLGSDAPLRILKPALLQQPTP